MPKKSTLKSRRNKRNVSLKKKSRKGGAVWDFLKSKEKPEPKEGIKHINQVMHKKCKTQKSHRKRSAGQRIPFRQKEK